MGMDMGRDMTSKIMRISVGALILSVVPIALWAVAAMRIHPEHEREAAFCLAVLEAGGSHINFADGRAIQLLGERLSYFPEASPESQEGRLAAESFLSESPSPERLANRLMTCRTDLFEMIQVYFWRSCGYGIGALSDDWSMRDQTDFYELTEGPMPEDGMEFLSLRWRILQ